MSTSSTVLKETSEKKSPREWREIWLKKLSHRVIKDSVPKEKANLYHTTIKEFLKKYPPASKFIPVGSFSCVWMRNAP